MLLLLACTSPPIPSMDWQAEGKAESTETYDDHEYKFITTAVKWDDAYIDCRARGMHILDVADAAEEAWVWALADAADPLNGWWHGYSDSATEGSFVWDGGSASTYTNWRPGEPNDFASNEDCASFADDGGGAWNDKDCSTLYPYICESGCEKSNWYADVDGDGFGDPATVERSCEAPTDLISDGSDCDDSNAATNPAGTEICDAVGADEDCDGLADDADISVDPAGLTAYFLDADSDGDGNAAVSIQLCELRAGYSATAGDCDDTDATRSSLATETADGYDNNCDGVDDSDGDGWESSADCDDANPTVSPSAVESCDGTDADCDGTIDDGATCPGISGTYGDHAYVFVVDALSWEAAQATCAGIGYHLVDVFDVSEEAWIWTEAEAANPTSSWWHGYNDRDVEGDFVWDGGGSSVGTDWRPGEPNDYAGAEDCAAFADGGGGAWNDKDCATALPFVCEAGCLLTAWYADIDGDGFGDPGSVTGSCTTVADAVLDGTDCDDGDPTVNTLGVEICDALDADEDCDGLIDEADDSVEISTCGESDTGRDSGSDSGTDSGTKDSAAETGDSGSADSAAPNDSTEPGDSGEPVDSGSGGGDSGPVDTDGDGLTDEQEAALGTNPNQPDSDFDGLSDSQECANPDDPRNSDGDDLIDALDVDDDGDGRATIDEGQEDPDGDRVPNSLDLDSDGDGCLDADETEVNWLDAAVCEGEVVDSGAGDSAEPNAADTAIARESAGCGCGTSGLGAWGLLLAVPAALQRRRPPARSTAR